MDITSHNIMNGIRKWLMEDDWNVIRLHLSHNDLDGHSCHIMSRLATNILNPNSKSPVTFWTSSAGTSSIEKTILRFIKKIESVPKDPKKQYVKGKKKLFILITDLGNFNPGFLNDLIKEGHNINYLLIDHHQVNGNFQIPELIGNAEEFQMAKNCYYVDYDACATKSFGDAVRAVITQKKNHYMTPQDSSRLQEMLSQVEEFSNRVDRFDRGLWGEWLHLTPDRIDGAVAEQLFFKSYAPEDRYKYVSIMANYFHTFMVGTDMPVSERPFWCVDMSRFFGFKYKCVTRELKSIHKEYTRCSNLVADRTIEFEIPDTIPNKDDLVIREIRTEENDAIHSFTLVSHEILKEHPEIDILILVYTARGTVDLRTQRDDINLFEIAFANGGGGHPKAAGFYMKKEDTE